MAWVFSQNPDGSASAKAQGGGSELKTLKVEFAAGVEVFIGRGVTDTDITFGAMRNAGGTMCYVYPDAAGTGIVVTTTVP
jgi:hypothetical protein